MMGPRKRELTSEETKENKKCCADCKTTKTPLWRGGPAGPKSLCNACGIRYRKRKIPVVSLSKRPERKKERAQSRTTSAPTAKAFTGDDGGSGGGGGEGDLSESLKKSLLALGKDLWLQRFPSVKRQRCQRRRKLGEEEQAAVSLLALSCGLVFG